MLSHSPRCPVKFVGFTALVMTLGLTPSPADAQVEGAQPPLPVPVTADGLTEQPGLQPSRMLCDLESWFAAPPGTRAGYVSSFDRTGGNSDGFKATYSMQYERPDGQQVIVDLEGPGCLYTLWFTGQRNWADIHWGQLRMYLDDEAEPRLVVDGKDLFAGTDPRFPRPLVADGFVSTGGSVSYVPIPFAHRLVITTEKRPGFYNGFYHLYPPGTEVTSWTGDEKMAPVIDAWRKTGHLAAVRPDPSNVTWHRGAVGVPGSPSWDKCEPQALFETDAGPGAIVALRINPGRPLSAEALNAMWLKIYWDGAERPAVEVPVGPFFGSGQGEATVRSAPLGMSPSGDYYCYLPMPFAKGARVTLENHYLDPIGHVYWEVAVDPEPPADLINTNWRFEAHYRRERATPDGRDYLLLDLADRGGLFLGPNLMTDPFDAANKKWWEGDLRIWVDERRDPILHGTGHEDEFLGGWSSWWLQNPYTLPYHGLPSSRVFLERFDHQWNSAISAYRFFIGGIPFRDGIRVSIEHGVDNHIITNYASVVYYYASSDRLMSLSDTLDVGDPDAEKTHGYRAVAGQRDDARAGHFHGDRASAAQRALATRGRFGVTEETFQLKLDPANQGVLLRRLAHARHGRHRGRVFVDGQYVANAALPDDHRVDFWHEADLVIPAEHTAGKHTITVRIEPFEGVWNAYRYEAHCLQGRSR